MKVILIILIITITIATVLNQIAIKKLRKNNDALIIAYRNFITADLTNTSKDGE